MTYQEVIEPLAGGFRVDFDGAGGGGLGGRRKGRGRFAPYNVFHLRYVV
ncbi:hypothetical protein [Acidovorax sp. FG27]